MSDPRIFNYSRLKVYRKCTGPAHGLSGLSEYSCEPVAACSSIESASARMHLANQHTFEPRAGSVFVPRSANALSPWKEPLEDSHRDISVGLFCTFIMGPPRTCSQSCFSMFAHIPSKIALVIPQSLFLTLQRRHIDPVGGKTYPFLCIVKDRLNFYIFMQKFFLFFF